MTVALNPKGILSPDDLTFNDVKDLITRFEKKSLEEVFSVLGEEDSLSLEAVDVLAYIIFMGQRKCNELFTLEDAYDQPISVLSSVLEGLQEDAPLQEKDV